MRKIVTKAAVFSVLFCLLAGIFAWSAEAAYNAKKAKYNKNALPPGWRHEAGYTLWRARRNLAANRFSYKKYQREKVWLRNRKAGRPVEDIAADALDWTVDEIEKFWGEHEELLKLEELLKFQPSGTVNE